MNLLLLGADHHTAGLDDREALAFNPADVALGGPRPDRRRHRA